VIMLVFVGFIAGCNLAWTALSGATLLMMIAGRDTREILKRVDWHLLVFFAGLFVVVDGLSETGLPLAIFNRVHDVFGVSGPAHVSGFAAFSIIGCNIFSNVPFVLVAVHWINGFANPDLMWRVLALSATYAGNLTILGSVANVIVMESATFHTRVGFWEYAKYGFPITVGTTAVGLAILFAMNG